MKLAISVILPFAALAAFIFLRPQKVQSIDQPLTIIQTLPEKIEAPIIPEITRPDGTASNFDRQRPLTERELQIAREFEALPDKPNPITKLQGSLEIIPPAENEKWKLGPAPNVEELKLDPSNPPKERDGSTLVSPAKMTVTTIHSTRLAELRFKQARNLGIESALACWNDRLHGIIEDDEIDIARQALRALNAQASIVAQDSGYSIECFGTKFFTRAFMNRTSIRLEILWLEKSDAKKAIEEWQRWKASRPESQTPSITNP